LFGIITIVSLGYLPILPPPKRTTAIKLTYLGYRIANLVDTQDSVFPVKQLPKCLDSPEVREQLETQPFTKKNFERFGVSDANSK
ncbi:hypothetical protein, partial [Nostoc sp. 'Peltigera malacea cyanobiont' DB3992]|uniref:hypothetical protein n=1 Tax=Nostoc sp. 'Peltigera malacea cyanobiont' DB3992 TaxID=1206980 RepID=UPI000C05F3B2